MNLRIRLTLIWTLTSLMFILLVVGALTMIFLQCSSSDQQTLIVVLYPSRFHMLAPLILMVVALIWGAK